MTVFLTTHYMEEAARADAIALMDSGKLKEQGTPFTLKEKYAQDTLKMIPLPQKEQEIKNVISRLGDYTLQKSNEALLCKIDNSMQAIALLNSLQDKGAVFFSRLSMMIVFGSGCFFDWYDVRNMKNVVFMLIVIAVIFLVVSAIGFGWGAREAKRINERLKARQEMKNQ